MPIMVVDRQVGLACFSPLTYTMIFNDLTPNILMSTFQRAVLDFREHLGVFSQAIHEQL